MDIYLYRFAIIKTAETQQQVFIITPNPHPSIHCLIVSSTVSNRRGTIGEFPTRGLR